MSDAPHPEFAKWYREVSLEDNVERRQARWEGVLAVVSEADRDVVEALVRLAYRTRPGPASSSLAWIRDEFIKVDASFPMHGNDRELEVLAGSCLAVLMQEGEDGAPACLAVTTASLAGARSSFVPMDLLALSEGALKSISDTSRRRPSLSALASTDVPKVAFERAAAKVKELQTYEGVAEAFSLAASDTSTALATLWRRQASILNEAQKFIRLQDEELQMLWWLTGGRSESYNCAFDAVPTDAQPLVFASELADATQYLPGPPSVRGLLSRAGLKERRKLSVPTAVNAADKAWLQTMIGETEPSQVTTPIHFAIARHLEADGNAAWAAAWAAAAKVDAGHTLSPLTLGELFYRERLLMLFN